MKQSKLMASLLAAAIAASTAPLSATEHLVPTSELRRQLHSREVVRTDHLRGVSAFFERESSRMKKAGLDVDEVKTAVAALSDEDLESLSRRVAAVDTEIAAGALSNQELTYIVIALGTAVLILVIVAA